jgi:hypothetical protein
MSSAIFGYGSGIRVCTLTLAQIMIEIVGLSSFQGQSFLFFSELLRKKASDSQKQKGATVTLELLFAVTIAPVLI